MSKMNVLIVYYCHNAPIRATTRDHLYCFRKYSDHCFFYLNMAVNSRPRFVDRIDFDLIIFHTTFACARWSREGFIKLVRSVHYLKSFPCTKIILPQDEFLNTDILCDFINELEMDCVFSVAKPSEWEKIYDTIDRGRVRFFYVMTGYIDEELIRKIERLQKTSPERKVDIGYRSWASPWLGRHGYLKIQLAETFARSAPQSGLAVDIYTDLNAFFSGDDWYRFLLRCRYTLGVEGGSSVLDRDGSIRTCTENYLKNHRTSDFGEIEKQCFPNQDGYLQLMEISPRQLEACITRTGQILIEGYYNGVLIPGEHYVELKKDFSNLDEVLYLVKDEKLRLRMTEKAYKDIVESGKYSYKCFVDYIIENSPVQNTKLSKNYVSAKKWYAYSRLNDEWNWMVLYYRKFVGRRLLQSYYGMTGYVKKILPTKFVKYIQQIRRGNEVE